MVTRERSDWSTVPAFEAPDPVRLRLSRHGTAVRVEWSPAGAERYAMLRLAYLPTGEAPALVGPMCCSPERAGFVARFWDFRIGDPIARDLHGLTASPRRAAHAACGGGPTSLCLSWSIETTK